MIWTTHSQTWVSLERMRRFTKEKCFPWLYPLGFFESISLNKLLNHDNPAVSVSQTVCATTFGLKNCCLSILSIEHRVSCSILSKRSTTELNSQRWEGCNPKGQQTLHQTLTSTIFYLTWQKLLRSLTQKHSKFKAYLCFRYFQCQPRQCRKTQSQNSQRERGRG